MAQIFNVFLNSITLFYFSYPLQPVKSLWIVNIFLMSLSQVGAGRWKSSIFVFGKFVFGSREKIQRDHDRKMRLTITLSNLIMRARTE